MIIIDKWKWPIYFREWSSITWKSRNQLPKFSKTYNNFHIRDRPSKNWSNMDYERSLVDHRLLSFARVKEGVFWYDELFSALFSTHQRGPTFQVNKRTISLWMCQLYVNCVRFDSFWCLTLSQSLFPYHSIFIQIILIQIIWQIEVRRAI